MLPSQNVTHTTLNIHVTEDMCRNFWKQHVNHQTWKLSLHVNHHTRQFLCISKQCVGWQCRGTYKVHTSVYFDIQKLGDMRIRIATPKQCKGHEKRQMMRCVPFKMLRMLVLGCRNRNGLPLTLLALAGDKTAACRCRTMRLPVRRPYSSGHVRHLPHTCSPLQIQGALVHCCWRLWSWRLRAIYHRSTCT